jgi:hypothetical protein
VGEAMMVTSEVDNDNENDNDFTQQHVEWPQDQGDPLSQAAAERAPNSDDDDDEDKDEDAKEVEANAEPSQPLINLEEEEDVAQMIQCIKDEHAGCSCI